MKEILTFNLDEDIKKIFNVLNIRIIKVDKNEQNETLDYLITRKQNLKNNLPLYRSFDEPLLIFHDFDEDSFDGILKILKVNGYNNILKAVVTDTNLHWPAALLYNELNKEREEFRKQS